MASDGRASASQHLLRREQRLRRFSRSIAVLLCATLLSGCEGPGGSTGGGGRAGPASSAAPASAPDAPGAAPSAAGDSGAIAPLRPPGADERPLLPGQGSGLAANPGMQPPKGLNVDTLFSEDIQDPMARIKRLENVVLDIRRDLNTALPSIMRLVAVEQDMQNLIGQLETLVDDPSSAPQTPASVEDALLPPQGDAHPEDLSGETQPTVAPLVEEEGVEIAGPPASLPAPIAPPIEKKATAPPAAAGHAVSSGPSPPSATATASATAHVPGAVRVRAAPHGDVTRLVIETGGPTAFHADLDPVEQILVVEIPDAAAASAGETASAASSIQGWNAQPMEGGQGVRVVVTMRPGAPVKILKSMALPASGGMPARIVVDLAQGKGG